MPIEKLVKATLLTDRQRFDNVVTKLIDFKLFHTIEVGQDRIENTEEYIQTLSRISAEIENLANELGIKREFGVMDYLTNKVQVKTYSYEFKDFRELVEELKKKISELQINLSPLIENRRKFNKELIEALNYKQNLEFVSKIGIDFETIKYLKRFFVLLVVVNSKTLLELKRSLPEGVLLISEKVKEDVNIALILSKTEYAEKISRIIGGLELVQIKVPEEKISVNEEIKKLEKKIGELRQKITELELKISYESKMRYFDIISLYELASLQYLNILNIKIARPLKNYVILEGYIPKRYKSDFEKIFSSDCFLEFEEVKEKDAPSLIVNKPVIKSFENITFMQGPANYHEIDPTPFVFFFFSLFYGFMYADLGGGLLIIALGLFFYLRSAGNLRQWGILLVTIGCASAIFGILHNEFFGFPIPFVHYQPVIELVKHGVGLNPEGLTFVLQISIIIGIAHLILGILLRLINGILASNKEDLVLAIAYLTFYISGVFLLYGLWVFGMNIGAYSSSQQAILGIPAYLYSKIFSISALIGLILILLARYIAKRLEGEEHIEAKELLGEGAMEVFDSITRLLSNTISYLRLAILVIVHSVFLLYLGSVVNLYLGNPIITTVVVGVALVLGNLGIAVLEGFVVFIQALRLHLYEWFTKFYYGEGKPFRTFNNEGLITKVKFKLNK